MRFWETSNLMSVGIFLLSLGVFFFNELPILTKYSKMKVQFVCLCLQSLT